MNKLKIIIKKILNIFSYILIIILIIYIAFILYQKLFTKNELLKIGNYYIFQIASGSMEDSLLVDDYIIIKKTDNYDIGDIVTYKEGYHYVTHRIIEINDTEIITKGDANNIEDNPIKQEQIIGKYLLKSSLLTLIFKYRSIFLIFIFGLFIINYIFDKNTKK